MDVRAAGATVASAAAALPTAAADDPLWYMDAIIYQLHVKAFFDSNGDGIGDFAGLTEKLDYIRDLGVNTVWVMPFYPSPLRDDGYDVSNYEDVHPPYGTRRDFRRFVDEAHARGLRVITELIVNHTSDEHPWFQAARRAPKGSVKRGYYVWSDDPNKYAGTRIIFTDTETSNWAWDPVAQQHYWHRFFSHQPDLNFDNPHVLRAVLKTMKFWLDMGVDGFRLDAIPYLVEREGTTNENNPETHAVVKKIRAELDRHYKGKLLLAEANMWPEDVRQYFGDGDECHMAYHFPMMPRLYMSIAMEDRYPLVEIMSQTPPIPANCQWAIFLRNHDELTLEMVTDRERDYMYRIFANDPRMRVNVGIRRRLAPLMENDRGKIELITFLLMTMPGAPILYYGDEIGMGDNIYLGDRNGVRTPMQWTPDRNAGFSRADPQRLYLPPIMDPVYGYEAVNVEAQLRSPSSLLHWTRRLVATRRRYQAFGRGTLAFLEPGNRKVLAFIREHGEEAMLCVANLSRVPQAVELDLARFAGRVPVELFGQESFPPLGKLPYLVMLPGHGYMAFRLATDAKPPGWHEERLPPRRLRVLVLSPDWQVRMDNGKPPFEAEKLFINMEHERLRDDILLPYLRARRWFAAKSEKIDDLRFHSVAPWRGDSAIWRVAFVDARLASGSTQRYFIPIAIDWETRDNDPMERYGGSAITRARFRDRIGLFYAAFANPDFARDMARAMGRNEEAQLGEGRLRFSSTAAFTECADAIGEEVRTPALEQTNTAVFFGSRLFLKGYRRLRVGVNPELEMGRFLTEVAPFPHIAPILGAVEYLDPHADEPVTLAILQRFIQNQGDLWTVICQHLGRMIAMPAPDPSQAQQPVEAVAAEFHLNRMALLGRRVAEMHRALATATGDAAFDPEPVTEADLEGWKRTVERDLDATFALVDGAMATLNETARAQVQPLAGRREELRERVRSIRLPLEGLVRTRYHGDLHLGQVLVAQDDFIIVDFEGEPERPLEERRAKASPLRDVAGMLRSFSYAAHAALLRREAGAVATEAGARALASWEQGARHYFLDGYARAAEGVASVPAQAGAFSALLDLFLIEKALYELRYEIANRPDWIEIPLRGLLELTTNDKNRGASSG
ncbi:MAG TPA: maltose alpha-D-glucosyltransferase [Usitatibacter sp.]|nr:maltose alpha-D-glucosyltransferase [Usitatibacter sp.]